MDGQLLDSVTMQYYDEWKDALLMLLIYATGTVKGFGSSRTAVQDTVLMLDQIVPIRFDRQQVSE